MYFTSLLSFSELAPSPFLMWYDSYTAGPLTFPLNADFHFSQAKGGATPTVCMTLQMMLRVVVMIFMLGVLNEQK